jgi:UDP-N-acetylglucosamine--N-acetylmuramyl-(pentapeptide) pyrophosphoryl-undecaprenol N-acetylglucosamine transferase
MRAYFTAYGVGLGHATRLVKIATQLKDSGVKIKFSSFGEAARYISMEGYECLKVPPLELAWSAEGGFSIKHSIARLPRLFTNFSKQINTELNQMIGYNPDIVVSDTRLSSLLTGKLLRIPVVVLLNQIKLLLSPRLRRFKAARLYEKWNGEFLGLMWSVADKILIPDLPPPYTIAENNIWGTITPVAKLEYVGFTTPGISVSEEQMKKVSQTLELNRTKPIVFVHVSGPRETRIPFIQTALDACRALRPETQYIISAGTPGGDTTPKKISHSGRYYEWCTVRDEIFAIADVLVLRGGHAVISQAIQFGKPIVTIPIDNHGEQLGNSEKVAKIGIGIMLKSSQSSEITNAIHCIIDNKRYQRKAIEMMALTEKLNGIDNVVKIIRSYLK